MTLFGFQVYWIYIVFFALCLNILIGMKLRLVADSKHNFNLSFRKHIKVIMNILKEEDKPMFWLLTISNILEITLVIGLFYSLYLFFWQGI